MTFLKIVKPPVVSASDRTESVVRKVILLCDANGDSALLSDRMLEILQDGEDILDVVALLNKSFGVKPSRKELSKVVTLGDLVSLFDEYRKKGERGA